MDARRKLLDFLEHKAFQPVLRADPKHVPANRRDTLREMQDKARTEIERFRHYGPAEEIVTNFRRDQHSAPARKVHQALAELGLPTVNDVRDDFEKLARELGVK
jgi:hypothetical protein